jgi:predicted glutamine amidotransferase
MNVGDFHLIVSVTRASASRMVVRTARITSMSGQVRELGRAFLASVALIKRNHRYSALNCLFSDGEKLFAYRDYAREPDYYSLYKAHSDNSWLISSEALDDSLRWEMLAKEEFLAIELGDRTGAAQPERTRP